MSGKDLQNIKAIGFDVDRTLFQYPEAWTRTIHRVVTDWAADQLHRDREEFEREFTKAKSQYKSSTYTLASFGLDGKEIFEYVYDNYPVDKFAKRDQKLIKLIETLKEKHKLFIISNGTQKQVLHKLGLLGLNERDFEPLVCCYDRGWAKPESAPFLYALEKLEVEPGEAVYVGDRELVDVEGRNK